MVRAQQLVFTKPGHVTIVDTPLTPPGPGEVTVAAVVSAISAGTEMLFYRGHVPSGMAVDTTLTALDGTVRYPLAYGYALVGRVVELGDEVSSEWQDQLVFAFRPHASHFNAPISDLLLVPAGLAPEAAALLPNMETAVSLVMDGRPIIGERVAVFGQGIVGLLTTWLLAQLPLAALLAIEPRAGRRATALRMGANVALDPAQAGWENEAAAMLKVVHEGENAGSDGLEGVDLAYELSGQPAALNLAVALTGYGGRIVIGSWYGQKQAPLDLGGHFHRSHMELISSQVSRLHPRWTGRWTKGRRLGVAWQHLSQFPHETVITHRFPLAEAAAAYELLDNASTDALQVLFSY